VAANLGPHHPAADYEAIGVTWIVESAWPMEDWYEDLQERVVAGPAAS
jgi:hypothetical protein